MIVERGWAPSRFSGLEKKIPARTSFLAGISLLKSPKPEYQLNPYI